MAKITTNGKALLWGDDQQAVFYGSYRLSINGDFVNLYHGTSVWRLDYKDTTIDDESFDSAKSLLNKLSTFSKGGGSGEGAVESVTGDGVDNTDPSNPVLFWPPEVTWSSISGKPAFVASGTNAAAARTSLGLGTAATTASTAYATAAQGALATTALQPADASNVSAADKIVKYSNIGAVNTAMPQFPENAVPLFLLDLRVPTTGGGVNSFLRLASNGTYSFVEAGRDFIITDFTTSITISRTYMSGNRKLVFNGVDLEITIPEDPSFVAGYNFTVVNKNSSPISILTTGLTSVISVGNLTHIDGYGEVHFTYLGSNVWKITGELTSI